MSTQIPIRFVIPGNRLRLVGIRAVAMIRTRVQELGADADGRPMAPYSTQPFARPAAGITQRARRALGDRLQLFTNKRGRLWAIIQGGYAALKAATYPSDTGHVNMTATGGMMRSLTVTEVSELNQTISIGFARQQDAITAMYHNLLGAGRRRVIRRWLGLTKRERQDLARMAAEAVIILPGG